MAQRARLVLAVTSALTALSALALLRYDRARSRRVMTQAAPDADRGASARAAPRRGSAPDAPAPAPSPSPFPSPSICLIEQVIGRPGARASLPPSLSRYRDALDDPEQFPRHGSFSPGERREGPLPLRAELGDVVAALTDAGDGRRRAYHLELRARVEPAPAPIVSLDFRVADHETLYVPRRVGEELRVIAITCQSRA